MCEISTGNIRSSNSSCNTKINISEPEECDLLRIAIPANVHRPDHRHVVNDLDVTLGSIFIYTCFVIDTKVSIR